MSGIKGLEILFCLKQKELKSKGDCVMAAIHCILINEGFCCVGTGEEFTEQDSETATELLPEGWNECQDLYCLRYRCKELKNRYLLKAVKAGNNLHVNLVLNEEKFSSITIHLDEFVSEPFYKFSETYKNLVDLNDRFQKEVLKKIANAGSQASASSPNKDKEKSSKKSSKKQKPDSIPTAVPIPSVNPIPVGVPDSRRHGGNPSFAIPQIGGSDLDPLGRRGGGMLFDPTGIPSRPFGRGGCGGMGLPPHAVPPGARFDPFSPLSPDRFNPDPDHFRPPDYDNMFM